MLLNLHGAHVESAFVQWYTLFFTGNLRSKKRSLLVVGPSDSGKSFFGSLVRQQLPKSRVFLPLGNSEFCWDSLDSDMHILGYSNDWRFSPKLPVSPCLNWLEGLDFTYNRKHQKPGEGKGLLCIFTSNDIENGWNPKDIAAFHARMATTITCGVKLETMGIQENEGNARLEQCKKCAAAALIWKSPVLAQHLKKYYPGMYPFYERSLGAFMSKRTFAPNRAAPTPQTNRGQPAREGCAFFR